MPQHIYAECERLRRLGTAATNAKSALLLTDGELRQLPHTDKDRWGGGQACMQAWHRMMSSLAGPSQSVRTIAAPY